VSAWYAQGLEYFTKAEEVVGVELAFTIPVISTDGEVLETPLQGIIDAVVRETDGTITIVEHKTSAQSSSYDEALIESDLQPSAYVEAARQLGLGDARFVYNVMSKAKRGPKLTVIEAPRSPDDQDRLFWLVQQAERLIEAGVFMPSAPDWRCSGCEFRASCVRAHRDILAPEPEPAAVVAGPAA
jgi:CRISPR/Cas system-associated exonuclease Cas4 (RecB family)